MWLQSMVGISVVFLALTALYFFIYIFGKVMKNKSGVSESKRITGKMKNIQSTGTEDAVENGELIAVITAAVQASLLKAGITPECRITVKSFKRVEADSPVWNTTGRKEVLN